MSLKLVLSPTISNHPAYFFSKNPLINPKVFLGDAVFDSCLFYSELLTDNTFGENKHSGKAYIPLNSHSGIINPDCKVNANGIPCCTNDDTLPMKYKGTSKRKNGLIRYKFVARKSNMFMTKPLVKFSMNVCANHHVQHLPVAE